MRRTLFGTLLLLLPLLAFNATTTHGFLDSVIDKAKQATDELVNETAGKLIEDQPATSEQPPPASNPSQAPDLNTSKTSEVVRSAQIDGVKLGMPIEEALSELKRRGYEMETPSQPSALTGVTVKGNGTTSDGAGYIDIMLRQMDGKVYQFKKDIGYLTARLPEDLTVATLYEKYHQELTSPFSGARYEHPVQNRAIHFDDMSPPPYNRKVTSPHAEVFIIPSEQNFYGGRWGASVNMHWKDLVGADW